MDGRNELFAQLFRDYRNDYSHYRILGFDFTQSNALHRKVFRLSQLAMLMSTARAGDGRLGFSYRASEPAYGYIRWENKPETEELAHAAHDTARLEGFRTNLQEIIAAAKANDIAIILASIPFRVEKFSSGVFPRDAEILPHLDRVVKANNRITRDVATMHALPFVDGASLARDELLFDDCHFRPEGERRLAALYANAIRPLIPDSS